MILNCGDRNPHTTLLNRTGAYLRLPVDFTSDATVVLESGEDLLCPLCFRLVDARLSTGCAYAGGGGATCPAPLVEMGPSSDPVVPRELDRFLAAVPTVDPRADCW